MPSTTQKAIAVILVSGTCLLASACDSLTPAPSPTAPVRTFTPPPSSPTPAATLTLTPPLVQSSDTSTPALPPATPTSGTLASNALLCKVRSQSVPNGAHFDPGAHFDMGWKVKNLGDLAWEPGNVEFGFFGGQRMYVSASFTHLQTTVDHLEMVFLGTDMVAPKRPGSYTAFWSLRQGDTYFCRMSVRITVP